MLMLHQNYSFLQYFSTMPCPIFYLFFWLIFLFSLLETFHKAILPYHPISIPNKTKYSDKHFKKSVKSTNAQCIT